MKISSIFNIIFVYRSDMERIRFLILVTIIYNSGRSWSSCMCVYVRDWILNLCRTWPLWTRGQSLWGETEHSMAEEATRQRPLIAGREKGEFLESPGKFPSLFFIAAFQTINWSRLLVSVVFVKINLIYILHPLLHKPCSCIRDFYRGKVFC